MIGRPSVARSRPRPPRRSARWRLAAVYGGLFLLSGATLLAATYTLFERATAYTSPQLPKIPRGSAVGELRPRLLEAQRQLTTARRQLAQALPLETTPMSPSGKAPFPAGASH
ncbi:MAG TPA: hypothetical protein VMD59_09155, partial [Acidimicrobiales bacterium]|nr:hypothetical protein [Acidimicrobiales bacterium]